MVCLTVSIIASLSVINISRILFDKYKTEIYISPIAFYIVNCHFTLHIAILHCPFIWPIVIFLHYELSFYIANCHFILPIDLLHC